MLLYVVCLGADKTTTTNHIVEKIQNLLKKTVENGASEEEAQTAATIAHNLMLKHNIEHQEKNEELGYTVRFLGEMTGRIQGYMSEIASLLAKFYFVEIIWINGYDPRTKKKGHILEVSDTRENVDVAEYVYNFISKAAVNTWDSKLKDKNFKFNLHKEFNRVYGYSGTAPQSIQGFIIHTFNTSSAAEVFITPVCATKALQKVRHSRCHPVCRPVSNTSYSWESERKNG